MEKEHCNAAPGADSAQAKPGGGGRSMNDASTTKRTFGLHGSGSEGASASDHSAPASDAGAHFASGANGVISTNAPRALSPFNKVIACVLSVLVALTTWNSYSIEEARELIIGDEATPMAAAPEGDQLLDEVDNGDTQQTANGEGGEGSQDGDDSEGDEQLAETGAPTDEELDALLPEGLVAAEKVLPSLSAKVTDGKAGDILTPATTKEDELAAKMAERIALSVNATDALRTGDVYHVSGGSLDITPSLGNLAVSLDGGYVGGVEDTDVVALTFEAPYVYANADGTFGQTLSEEEWKARDGEKDGIAPSSPAPCRRSGRCGRSIAASTSSTRPTSSPPAFPAPSSCATRASRTSTASP